MKSVSRTLFLTSDYWNPKIFANLAAEYIENFRMSRHCGKAFRHGVAIHRMLLSFSREMATMLGKVGEQLRALHKGSTLCWNRDANSFFVCMTLLQSRCFAALLKHKQNRLAQVGFCFFHCSPLGIHTRQFLNPSSNPFAFFMKYCSKFTLHMAPSYVPYGKSQVVETRRRRLLVSTSTLPTP